MTDPITRLNAALEGRYAIEREIGEGGMATVYLAEDLRHERKVALKVLKPELAAVVGAERFLAEIKTTVNLQHPHVLPLFDSGEENGFLYYVMPYVEGESLRERLDRDHQLPVDEAVSIATNMAEALDYAHRQGVIHRDIKPANVLMLDGKPVISDFGIALAVGTAGGGRLTETGLSLGTPHYMSPEQATGDQNVGPQTDTYALGCVLYEMLVGEPPYTGPNAQAVLGQIITGDAVSATGKRASVPPNVDAAIRKALEKLPADRFASAQEFAGALGDPGFRHGGEAVAVGAAPQGGLWKPMSLVLSLSTLIFAVGFGWLLLRPEPSRPLAQFESPFREGQGPTRLNDYDFNLSPDGSMLVYLGPGAGRNQLWMRRWGDLEATPVRGTEGAVRPAVSPDGQQLAFDHANEIKVLSFEGGPIRTLVEGRMPRWGPGGYIYFGDSSLTGPAMRVPATGGPAESVTELAEGEQFHRITDFLPSGDGALVEVQFTDLSREVRALGLDTGELTTLTPGSFPRYAATGHLTFVAADGPLMAAPFDPRSMEITGPSVAMIEGVGGYTLSDMGSLVYSSGTLNSVGDIELVWVTRSGEATAIDPGLQFDAFGAGGSWGWNLSPEGTQVAVTRIVEQDSDVWIKQLPDGPFERLTFDAEAEMSPAWSPDGQYVVYSRGLGATALTPWRSRVDGTGSPERLLDDPLSPVQGRWSVDDDWMVFRTVSQGGITGSDIVGFRLGTDDALVPLVATQFVELGPDLSADGRWLAYSSNESGREEVYARPFPDVNSDRVQVSTNGGSNPRWANSGTELFFVDSERNMNAAQVEAASELRVLERQVLFPLVTDLVGYDASISDGGDDFYDVEAGDQRFLMGRVVGTADNADGPRLILVQNFFEELRQVVP